MRSLLKLFTLLLVVGSLFVLGACELDEDNNENDAMNDINSSSSATITITDSGVTNGQVSIQVGGSVTFQNSSSDPEAIDFGDDAIPDTNDIAPGGSTSVTFNSAGQYGFTGLYNTSIAGVIVVE